MGIYPKCVAVVSLAMVYGRGFQHSFKRFGEKGGIFNKWSARAFNNFILQAKVVDIPLREGSFTWSNNRIGGMWARLDRFLVSPILLSWFKDLEQFKYPRSISDHCAISLVDSNFNWGLMPFKFNNSWPEDKDLIGDIKLD